MVKMLKNMALIVTLASSCSRAPQPVPPKQSANRIIPATAAQKTPNTGNNLGMVAVGTPGPQVNYGWEPRCYEYPFRHCHGAANDFCDLNPHLSNCGVVVCGIAGFMPHTNHTVNWVIVDGVVYVLEPQVPELMPIPIGRVDDLGNPPKLTSPPAPADVMNMICAGQISPDKPPVALPPKAKVPESPPEVCAGLFPGANMCTGCCNHIADYFPAKTPGFIPGTIEDWRVQCFAACNALPGPVVDPPCEPGQHSWNGQCLVCPAGGNFFEGNCYFCPPNHNFWRGGCYSCPEGYQFRDGQCHIISSNNSQSR